jgi:hypothetical protein
MAWRRVEGFPQSKHLETRGGERMFRTSIVLPVLSILLAITASSASATTLSGSLSSASSELGGVGDWINPGTTTIAWEVTDMGSHYHYKYTLTVPQHAISHFIIEISPTAESSNFWNFGGPFQGTPVIDDYTQLNGNPDIPAPIYGIKFDEAFGTTAVFEFDSTRVPVWGDFYAKCGANPANQVWNMGITLPDPTDPAANGSIDNHILVPDSYNIPEPSTLVCSC